MRAFLRYKLIYFPNYDLYFYREHEASLTSLHSGAINDISKIMVERQIPQLEKKLPAEQLAFLYRKFAVFNAVQKNNFPKYGYYLKKLWPLSKHHVFTTIPFVFLIKLWFAIKGGAKGIIALLSLLTGSSKKSN